MSTQTEPDSEDRGFRLESRLGSWIAHRPTAILASFALAAILLGWLASGTTVAPGLNDLLIAGDPDLARNDEIRRDFSNDELIVVAFDLGREVDAAALEMLAGIHRQIEILEGVDQVLDLSSIEDVRASEDETGFLDASALVDLETVAVPGEIERIRQRLRSHRLYQNNLVSADLRVVSTLVIPSIVEDPSESHSAGGGEEPTSSQAELNARLTQAIYQIVQDAPVPAWVSGYPPAEFEAQRIVLRDLGTLSALALAIILLLVYVLLRRGWALILILLVAGWTELCALAWLAFSGSAINIVTSTLPVVLLATSSTYTIYLLNLLARVSQRAGPRSPRLGPALLSEVIRPCLLSAASTATGFLALLLMPVPAIRDLGVGLAAGIVGCLVASLLLVPAIVQRFDLRLEKLPLDGRFHWTGAGIALARRRGWVLLATGLVIVASLAGIARLQVESDPLTYWRSDHFHRRSDDFIRERLGGSLFLNATISTGQARGAMAPEVLQFAQRWIEFAERSPVVSRTVSILDYLALIDLALDQGRGEYLGSRELASQYLIVYENSGDAADLRHYIDFDRSALNILLRVDSRSSNEILQLQRDLLDFAKTNLPQGAGEVLRTEVLGTWLLFPKAMDAITRGMVRGLTLAAAVVLVVMALFLGSLRLGLVALVPNSLPTLVCLGALGWLGVPLSFGTSIVGCIALGLAVDDTAHVLGHLRRGRTLEDVYRQVGRALTTTTLCLGAGFLALTLSGFLPLVHFGLATSATLVVALACDLFVLPSLLRLGFAPAEATIAPAEAAVSTAARGSVLPTRG